MKASLGWIDDRTGLVSALRGCGERRVAGRACWCKVWPCAVAFAFFVQAITGFFLWVYYSPSVQTAWASVYELQDHVVGGSLLRAVHHYSAHVLLAILMIYVVQTIVTAAYRAPRELVFWMAVGMGLFALAAILTGDLLSWDQNGYSSTKTRTGFLTLLPGIGQGLLQVAIGGPGPELGQHTLTRFFALHVGVFATGFLVLLILHEVFARRADAAQAASGHAGDPFWPSQAWRSAVACVVVLAVVLLLACRHAGVPLGSPADTDPQYSYDAARPEWFLRGVYQFSHYFAGASGVLAIFVIPGLVVCVVLAMPFVARRPAGQLFNVAFTAFLLIAIVTLSWISYAKDAADGKHQAAIRFEEQQANRMREVADREGIPAAGPLALLRSTPLTQGPRLFRAQCASCHNYSNQSDDDLLAEKPSAPNLRAYATRAWIEGLLGVSDPAAIKGPDYFGNTKLRNGEMITFIRELWSDAKNDGTVEEQKEEFRKVAAALSAEAQLPAQRAADQADAKIIQEGRKLISSTLGCTQCHKFQNKGGSDAPNLTGYGTRAWIMAITANPADPRFYDKKNDRMPAYADLLTDHDIGQLADWLRGEWYGQEGTGD